jgi:hypothetical protein
MPKHLARILKTEIAADVPLRAMAEAVRVAGRGKDTVLAHITPREARNLKRMGGRGSINPATGLLEFENDFYEYDPSYELPDNYELPAPVVYETPGSPEAEPEVYGPSEAYGPRDAILPPDWTAVAERAEAGQLPTRAEFAAYPEAIRALYPGGALTSPGMATVYSPGAYAGEGQVVARQQEPLPAPKPGFMEKLRTGLEDRLSDPFALAALGVGGLGLLSNLQRAKAGQRQAAALRQEQEQIAAPYRTAGQEAIARAQRGELTAAGQQVYQRMQARQAQQAARRGGVGAQQAAVQLEAARQDLISKQMDYGLKLSGIADNVTLGAIKTGLEADKESRAVTGAFFTAMMQAMGSVGRGR